MKKAAEGGYDTVIFVGGQNHFQDLEGHDRPNMKLLYAQDKLIEELFEVVPDMIMVMFSGSPVEMPWISRVHTLVWSWFNGMEGGTALAEILFGKSEPIRPSAGGFSDISSGLLRTLYWRISW